MNAPDYVAEGKDEASADYGSLRRDLVDLLIEHHAQGRFPRLAEDSARARSIFRADLTHSIADILVTAHPKTGVEAFAAALADAEIMIHSVIDGGLPTSN